jgi:hypothetical protein
LSTTLRHGQPCGTVLHDQLGLIVVQFSCFPLYVDANTALQLIGCPKTGGHDCYINSHSGSPIYDIIMIIYMSVMYDDCDVKL